jgi:hypothetical protein
LINFIEIDANSWLNIDGTLGIFVKKTEVSTRTLPGSANGRVLKLLGLVSVKNTGIR